MPPTPTPTPLGRVTRLKVVLTPSGYDTNVPWLGGRSGLLDKRPAFEFLLGINRFDGSYQPELARRWEVAADGRSWTFLLREGVQFHDGWGEWTARDVVHTGWSVRREDSKFAEAGLWRSMLGRGNEPAAVDDQFLIVNEHEIIFLTLQPTAELDGALSANGIYTQQSKAFWDAAGLNGYVDTAVGTGPYKLIKRRSGEHVLYERVDAHWRKTPEFRELEISTTADPARRLALLTAGEAHIADIHQDLREEAIAGGMEISRSAAPTTQAAYQWGGLHFSTPGKLDLTEPFTDIKVREAMNRAVNRREIIDTYLPGKAEVMPLFGYHRTLLPGYNRRWEERFDEMYGYDPQRASELLAEAGYPDGFEFTLYVFPYPGLREMSEIGEALGGYFEALGLRPHLTSPDLPIFREEYLAKSAHGKMWPIRMAPTSVETMIGHWAHSMTGGYAFEAPRIDELFPQLREAVVPAERARLMGEIGDVLYDNYAYLNLFWVFAELMIDPGVIEEYVFPGTIAGVATHLEYVVPAAR